MFQAAAAAGTASAYEFPLEYKRTVDEQLVQIEDPGDCAGMLTNETRKLMKLLNLSPDQIYHVFCLALCMATADGKVSDQEGEMLTRIGFGLGLTPEDITALGLNAKQAMAET